MKMLVKKMMVALLCAASVFSSSVSAFVTGCRSYDDGYSSILGAPVLSDSTDCLAVFPDGTQIVAAHRMTEDGPVELTREEFAALLATIEAQESVTLPALDGGRTYSGNDNQSRGLITTYSQSGSNSSYHMSSLRTRVSNYLVNQTSNPASISFSCWKTQSATASISLSSADKTSIQATTGFSYSTSYTWSQTITATVSPGNKGWIEFYPIMHRSHGYLRTYNVTDFPPYNQLMQERYINVYFPKSVCGGLDGVYFTMQAKN